MAVSFCCCWKIDRHKRVILNMRLRPVRWVMRRAGKQAEDTWWLVTVRSWEKRRMRLPESGTNRAANEFVWLPIRKTWRGFFGKGSRGEMTTIAWEDTGGSADISHWFNRISIFPDDFYRDQTARHIHDVFRTHSHFPNAFRAPSHASPPTFQQIIEFQGFFFSDKLDIIAINLSYLTFSRISSGGR